MRDKKYAGGDSKYAGRDKEYAGGDEKYAQGTESTPGDKKYACLPFYLNKPDLDVEKDPSRGQRVRNRGFLPWSRDRKYALLFEILLQIGQKVRLEADLSTSRDNRYA